MGVADIIIVAVIILLVAASIIYEARRRKKSKGCGSGCGGCPHSGTCNKRPIDANNKID